MPGSAPESQPNDSRQQSADSSTWKAPRASQQPPMLGAAIKLPALPQLRKCILP
jgi:hypothetical protein